MQYSCKKWGKWGGDMYLGIILIKKQLKPYMWIISLRRTYNREVFANMTTFKKWIEGKDHIWMKEGKVTINRNHSSLTCECVCVWG